MQICSSLQGTRTSYLRSATVDVKPRSPVARCHKVWRLRPGTMRLGWQRRSLGYFGMSSYGGYGNVPTINRGPGWSAKWNLQSLITTNPEEPRGPLQQCQRLRITTLSNFKSRQNYLMWADSIHSYDAWGMILTWNTFCVSDLFG